MKHKVLRLRLHRIIAVTAVMASVCGLPASAAPSIYDNFSDRYLDVKRWTPLLVPLYAQEWRREIGRGKLRLFLRGTPGSSDESLIGGHRNILNGVAIPSRRAAAVRSIQAQIEIASADVRRCSRSDAEISEGMFFMSSAWFNDGRGRPGRNRRGDVSTSFAISHNSGSPNQLNIIAQVYRNEGPRRSTQLYRRGLGVVGFGVPLIIRVTWDENNNTFRFYRKTVTSGFFQSAEVDYTLLPDPTTAAGPAMDSFHTLQARSEPAFCGREATHAEIDVLVDQIRISNRARGN